MRPVLLLSGLLVVAAGLVGWLVWGLGDGDATPVLERGADAVEPGAPDAVADLATPGAPPAGPARRLEPDEPVRARAAGEGAVPRGDATLSGVIVDVGGRPVPGATVLLGPGASGVQLPLDTDPDVLRHFHEVRRVATGPDGSFAFAGLGAGALRLAVRATGYAPRDEERLRLGPGQALELPAIVLRPGMVLAGRVVDADGRPVAAADLVRPAEGPALLAGGGSVLARTAADGSFRIETLAPGPWTIHVRTPEHPVLAASGDAPAPGQVVAGLELRLERGERLAGRVVGDGPEPLEDLVVLAVLERRDPAWDSERRADVGADGAFELRGLLPDRTYELVAALRGATTWSLEPASAPVRTESGRSGVLLTRTTGGDVLARVTDALTGEVVPQPSLRVEPEGAGRRRLGARGALLAWGDERLSRDDDGLLRARGIARALAGSSVRVELAAEGYEPWSVEGVPVLAGRDVDLGEVALRPVAGVRVRVVDATTREPVEGAVVFLRAAAPGGARAARIRVAPSPDELVYTEGRRRRTTDADGRATVPSEDGGLSFVWAHHPDHAPAWPVRARPDGTAEVELRLGQGGTVAVDVVAPDGAPAAGARVAVARFADDAAAALLPARLVADRPTDDAGRASFPHLVPGRYVFLLLEDDAAAGPLLAYADDVSTGLEDPGRALAVVEEGSNHALRLQQRPRATLHGVVTAGGSPLAGALVRLVASPDDASPAAALLRASAPTARTDGEGAFRLPAVRTGPWRLVVEHPARAMAHVEDLRLPAGESRRVVELDEATLAGHVTDAADQPVAGARVWVQEAARVGDPGSTPGVRVVRTGSTEVATDADGAFELRGVRPGVPLVVTATHATFQPAASPPVTARPGQRVEGLALRLARGGDLLVRVSGGIEGRAAVVLAPVDFPDPVPPTEVRATGADGTARFTGLAAGTWEVQVSDLRTAGLPEKRRVRVEPGATAELDVALP